MQRKLSFIICLVLFLISAAILCFPSMHYQETLSTGDHGRDLYASQAVYRGELPYKDFWWVYGPLMPYYYGLFFKCLGTKIPSMIIGKIVLKILCGLAFFLACRIVVNPWISLLAALWFLGAQGDFFFTFNHIGGILMTIIVMGMGLRLIKTPTTKDTIIGLIAIFVLGLIKINFAISAGAAFALALILAFIIHPTSRTMLCQRPYQIVLISGAILVPLLWFATYMFFLKGLSITEIRQCLPYLDGDQPYSFKPSTTIPYYYQQMWITLMHHIQGFKQSLQQMQQLGAWTQPGLLLFFFASLANILLHGVWHISTLGAMILHLFKAPTPQTNPYALSRRVFWAAFVFILGFLVLNVHEFIFSGVWYRSFWMHPMLIAFHFIMIGAFLSRLPKLPRFFLTVFYSLILLMLITVSAIAQSYTISKYRQPSQFLASPKGQCFVSNEPAWVDTVNRTTAVLNSILTKDDRLFTFPYDVLYNYLTNTVSPTRQLIFFDHIKITPEQEQSILAELEKNRTTYVLVSNRIAANETGLGIFGKTYCPAIYQYLMTNFTLIYRYGGNWQAEPGWANNHGVMLFKRK